MKIRAKKGFNIVVKDLGITLRSEKKDWLEISDEDYHNSKDIKSLLKFIETKNGKAKKEDLEEKVDDKPLSTETAFCREGRLYSNPKDVYIRYESEDLVDISKDVESVVSEEIPKESEITEQAEVVEEEQGVQQEEIQQVESKLEEPNKSKGKKNSKNNKKVNDTVVEENKTIDITVEK